MAYPLSRAFAAGLLLAAAQAGAATIDFENLASGSVLSTQYASLGVTFSANAFSGAGTSSSGASWATNTDMTIVSSASAADAPGLASASLVSGNVLHGYNGWLDENGDASFRLSFSSAVTSISASFAGVSDPADVRLFAYNGSTLLGSVAGSAIGEFTLSYFAPLITSVVITPGSYDDWVAVDNIVFAVPEPSQYALMALGLGLIGVVRRKQSA